MRTAIVCGAVGATILLLGAATAAAETRFVQNPGNGQDISANINIAVLAAGDGDTVSIPAGKFPISGSILINKLVSVRGASAALTVLYRDDATPDSALTNVPMFDIRANRPTPSNIRVRGLTLRSKTPSIVASDSGSRTADIGIRFNNTVDFKVEGCRFEYFGDSAIVVRHEDTIARGLITRNEFYRNAKGFDGLGLGYGVSIYGADNVWVASPQFGSDNFIFIENNTFDFHRHAVAAGGTGLYVARYDLITNNIIADGVATQAIDAHEGRGGVPHNGNFFATRALEAYRNTIVNETFRPDATGFAAPIVPGQNPSLLGEAGIYLRGGEALIHQNTVSGYRFAIGLTESFGTNVGASYPVPYSAGYLSGSVLGVNHSGDQLPEADGDVFFCENSFTPYPNPASTEFHNYRVPAPGFPGLQEGRDFHPSCKPSYVPYPYPHPVACEADDISPCLELPLVHYSFNATDVGLDSSNLHRNGQVLAGRTAGNQGEGLALQVGGADGVAEFAANAPELNLLGEASGVVWVKPAGPQAQNSPGCGAGAVFSKGGNLALLVTPNNDELWFESEPGGGGIVTESAELPVGKWSHLAFTRTATNVVQFYLNGLPLGGPHVSAVPPVANSANFTIGYLVDGAPSDCEFNGSIDKVKIFDRVLSPQQVFEESKVVPVAVPALPTWALLLSCLLFLGMGTLIGPRNGGRASQRI